MNGCTKPGGTSFHDEFTSIVDLVTTAIPKAIQFQKAWFNKQNSMSVSNSYQIIVANTKILGRTIGASRIDASAGEI